MIYAKILGLGVFLFLAYAEAVTPFYEHFAQAEQAFAQGQKRQALKKYLFFVQNFHAHYAHPPYLGAAKPVLPSRTLSIEQRQSLYHAYLRLVQIDLRPEHKSHWLRQALAMAARSPQAALLPDAQLFPPPLVQEYYAVQKNFRLAHKAPAPTKKALRARALKTPQQNKFKDFENHEKVLAKPNTSSMAHSTWLKRVGAAVLVGAGVAYSYHYLRGRSRLRPKTYQEGF